MRSMLLLSLVCSPGLACEGRNLQLGEISRTEPIELSEMLSDLDRYVGKHVAVRGRIGKVCQRKGCWMMLAEGDDAVRVRSGDRFRFPGDAVGHGLVHGTFERVQVSAGRAAHYAEDASEPSPGAGDEYQIDAKGALLELEK